MDTSAPSESSVFSNSQELRFFAESLIKSMNEGHIKVSCDSGYPFEPVRLLHMADRIERNEKKSCEEAEQPTTCSSPTDGLLTIEEAISHAKEVSQRKGCTPCGNQHKQLADWLTELKELRGKHSIAEKALQELADYDKCPDGMDDPGCADGHTCAEIARNALSNLHPATCPSCGQVRPLYECYGERICADCIHDRDEDRRDAEARQIAIERECEDRLERQVNTELPIPL